MLPPPLFVLLACGALLAQAGLPLPHSSKLYEVTPATRDQADRLATLWNGPERDDYDVIGLSKLANRPTLVVVTASAENRFLTLLQHHGIASRLLESDVGVLLRREFEQNRLLHFLKPLFIKDRLSTERYYAYDEISAYVDELARRYPERAFVKVVGKSYEGRLLKTLTITNGDRRPNKNVIFLDAGMHAREWISHAAALYVLEQLVENFEQNADLLSDYDWVVLPVVNPDGYEYSRQSAGNRLWRKTRKPYEDAGRVCYGADPNRNFEFHWMEEGASPKPCSDIFAGPKAFSEPETQIVRDIIHTLRGRGKMYLTIHSYGKYLLYPWGWTSELPETWEDIDEVARAGADAIHNATGTVYTVGSSTNVLYVAAGASDDYAFAEGFPISITMELPGGGAFGFNPPPSSIDGIVKETWIGIRAMAQKVADKYPTETVDFL